MITAFHNWMRGWMNRRRRRDVLVLSLAEEGAENLLARGKRGTGRREDSE
jgi:hypothetical protein